MLTVKACCEKLLFTEWSDEVFYSLLFRKYISYDHHFFFFLKRLKYYVDFRNGTKNLEKIFNCQIIAFELGVGNSPNLQ